MPEVAALQDFEYRLQLQGIEHKATGDWPDARSAHGFVTARSCTLLLLGGDSGQAGQRFDDLWCLNITADKQLTWRQITPPAAVEPTYSDSSCQELSHQHWYTARSNATVAIAGDWLVVFGGWNCSGLRPLAAVEVFHLITRTWWAPAHFTLTGCDGAGGGDGGVLSGGPSARGQPAAAANTVGTAVYVFGGWDGHQRYNDLWRLIRSCQGGGDHHHDGDDQPEGQQQWTWELVVPTAVNVQGTPMAAAAATTARVPCPRADHVMVCWHYCDDGVWKDLLVVFGGSSSEGLLNDTWLFDIRTNTWTRAYSGGVPPCPRSSCAAAISGDMLLVHGGQGDGGGVLADMNIMMLSTLTWIQVDLSPITQPLCRHSMAVTGNTCWVFGGYTGSSSSGSNSLIEIDLRPMLQMHRSSSSKVDKSISHLDRQLSVTGALELNSVISDTDKQQAVAAVTTGSAASPSPSSSPSPSPPSKTSSSVIKLLNKSSSPAPLRLSDLPDADHISTLPQWKQIRHLHQAALAAGCDTYIDPHTGYSVFTSDYLKQRECCGNKCRHCPWGWKNVANTPQSTQW